MLIFVKIIVCNSIFLCTAFFFLCELSLFFFFSFLFPFFFSFGKYVFLLLKKTKQNKKKLMCCRPLCNLFLSLIL